MGTNLGQMPAAAAAAAARISSCKPGYGSDMFTKFFLQGLQHARHKACYTQLKLCVN